MRTRPAPFSLAFLMALIGVIAVGLAAMRHGSLPAIRATFTLTFLMLLIGLLGAIVRRGEPAWIGFALFGWSFVLLTYVPAVQTDFGIYFPAAPLCQDLAARLHPPAGPAPNPPDLNTQFMVAIHDITNVTIPGFLEKHDPRRASLSPAEEEALDAYIDQLKNYKAQVSAIDIRRTYAQEIGQRLFVLVFGLAGAFLGRALAASRRLESSNSDHAPNRN